MTKHHHIEVIDDATVAMYRDKTSADRLRILSSMFRFVRQTLLAAVRADHPEWTPEMVNREVARRVAGGSF